MNRTLLMRRVAYRMGVGVWNNRGPWLVGLAAAAVFSVWQTAPALLAPLGVATPEVAGVQAAGGDCADVMMDAVATKALPVARAAYRCLGTDFAQTMDEDQFVSQLRDRGTPGVERVTRVGQYPARDGGSIVYFAVENRTGVVGYVVYLGRDGKILKIE